VHHYELLSSESLIADSAASLAPVWDVDIPAVRLHGLRSSEHLRCDVVPGAEGLLLHDCGPWLRDHGSARRPSNHSTDSLPNTTTHAATHASANATRSPERTS